MIGRVFSKLVVPLVLFVGGFMAGYLPSTFENKTESFEKVTVEIPSKRCIVSKYKPTSFETSVKSTE